MQIFIKKGISKCLGQVMGKKETWTSTTLNHGLSVMGHALAPSITRGEELHTTLATRGRHKGPTKVMELLLGEAGNLYRCRNVTFPSLYFLFLSSSHLGVVSFEQEWTELSLELQVLHEAHQRGGRPVSKIRMKACGRSWQPLCI